MRECLSFPARIRAAARAVLITLAGSLAATAPAATPAGAPAKILREGQASYHVFDATQLPPDAPSALYGGEVTGKTFEIFVRNLDAQPVTIEMGFLDLESKSPQQRTFSISANGDPLDANLDVFSKAGSANKPWVMKSAINHPGGSLSIILSALQKSAFINYARITSASGKELAFGTAKDWKNAERLTLLDSRSRPFHIVKVGDIPFYDVDHSPVGAWSTFIYGMEASGGIQVCKQPGGDNTLIPHQGIIIAAKNGSTERVMPFTSNQPSLPKGALIMDKEVTRTLGACTDNWKIPLGISWTHYTPVWQMKEWTTASTEEKRRFTLPVTWMQYHIDNRDGKDETQLLFSLQQTAVRATGWNGFDGYVVDQDSNIAVKSGAAELLTQDQARERFGVAGATSAFCIHVPAGHDQTVTFYIAQGKGGVLGEVKAHPLKMMCTTLFSDVNDVLKTAESSLPAMIAQCDAMDKKLTNCGQDEERRFNAADSLHSYQYNTVLYATDQGDPVWTVIEGECACINTFDLTVDHVFYELAMHPWTVRNELDYFSDPFSFVDELSLPGQKERVPGGISFWHDMGKRTGFSNSIKGASYTTLMSQEELQNWILCAALYWRTTGDTAWLNRNRDLVGRAFHSMELRDDVDPARRDGITTYISNFGSRSGEITTYDAMDASLQHPINSLYIAMKSFACYTMLKPVFAELGEAPLAAEAQKAENYTAAGILSHFDESRHYFPALFDGKNSSAIIPAVEGLSYVYAMGMTPDLAFDGPNGDLLNHLKTHLQTVLVPGVCIDAQTGAWNLSSTSHTTWQSKVYLNQFVTENVLGIKNDVTGRTADRAQYAYQVEGAPAVGWTDQIYSDSHIAYGCRHYPRGVTSALWWLWPPAPTP